MIILEFALFKINLLNDPLKSEVLNSFNVVDIDFTCLNFHFHGTLCKELFVAIMPRQLLRLPRAFLRASFQ